jgi:hypothetical protein
MLAQICHTCALTRQNEVVLLLLSSAGSLPRRFRLYASSPSKFFVAAKPSFLLLRPLARPLRKAHSLARALVRSFLARGAAKIEAIFLSFAVDDDEKT